MAAHQDDFVLQLLLELVDDNGGDDHQALNDHLPEVANAHHHHAVGKEDDHEGADNRAGHPATASCQRGSAEHGGADGVHLKHVAGHRVGGL